MSIPLAAGLPLPHATLAPTGPPRGAVVLLHGFGADEQDMLGLALRLPRDLLCVALQAPLALPWAGRAWYPLDLAAAAPAALPTEAAARACRLALGAIIASVEAVPGRFGVAPGRTVLVGFSQGAAMAAAALLAPGAPQIAGYALLSGYLVDPSAPAPPAKRRTSVFIAHGTEDGLLPVDLGRSLREQVEALGIPVTYREYPMGHVICAAELADIAAWLHRVLGEGTT